MHRLLNAFVKILIFKVSSTQWPKQNDQKTIFLLRGPIFLLFNLNFQVFSCYSTPNEHPYISESEKESLNKAADALIRTVKYDLDPLPWKAYLSCVAFWSCVVGYVSMLRC